MTVGRSLARLALLSGVLLQAACFASIRVMPEEALALSAVRLKFAQAREVVLSRSGKAPLVVAEVTAVYGRVLSVTGDTLRIRVARVSQGGPFRYFNEPTETALVRDGSMPLEVVQLNQRRTVLLVASVVLLAYALMIFALSQMPET